MTPADLRKSGERLYGPRWQTKLAWALPLKTTRTIRHWLSGKRKIRPLVAERIRSLASEEPRLLLSLDATNDSEGSSAKSARSDAEQGHSTRDSVPNSLPGSDTDSS